MESHSNLEPSFYWNREEGYDTLVVSVPGYIKEELKVQLSNCGNLKISGERALGDNRYNRFYREFQISKNVSFTDIRAKFDNGVLYITITKTNNALSSTGGHSKERKKNVRKRGNTMVADSLSENQRETDHGEILQFRGDFTDSHIGSSGLRNFLNQIKEEEEVSFKDVMQGNNNPWKESNGKISKTYGMWDGFPRLSELKRLMLCVGMVALVAVGGSIIVHKIKSAFPLQWQS